jgi:hypothetical protein
VQIYVDDTNTLVFTTGRVLVLQWRREVTLDGMTYVQRAYDDLRTKWGVGLFLFTVVGDAAVPDKPVRVAIAEFMRKANGVFVASVAAYTAKGMRAALVRQVAFALALLARTTYRHEPCAGIEQAVAWLEKNAHIKDGAELRACLAAMGMPP